MATLLVSFGLSTACQSAQAEALEQWVLEQNYEGKGDVRVLVAPKAVAVYNKQSNYKAVAKAPDWKVHIFRADQKTEWTGALKHFNGKMLSDPIGSDSTVFTTLKTGESGQIKGLKYIRYFDKSNNGEIFGASDIVTAPQATEFLCRYYDCPVLSKAPLTYIFDKVPTKLPSPKTVWLDVNVLRSTRGGRITKLTTTAWKKTAYQPNDFALPQNYKQINTLTDITFSPGQQEAFNEALNGLGFTTDLEKARKK